MTLQMIAEEEHLKIMKKLLTINIDVNIITADYDDQTTLQIIADEEHLKMTKKLLMTNININIIAVADDYD